MKKQSFVKSAAILSAGAMCAKLLGAAYRIPLTNILGAQGMGMYQLAFPLYAVLLTVTTSGLPVAISKLVAENNQQLGQSRRVLMTALKILIGVGLAATTLMFVFSSVLARIQGDELVAGAYRALAPSVVLVCVVSALRGYFQGHQNMLPTAVSQNIEQIVKIGFSLFFALKFMPDTVKAVTYTVFAITLSEAAALVYLLAVYAFKHKDKTVADKTPYGKALVLLAVPLTLSGIVLPLSQLIDSLLVVNILNGYTSNATALYGLFSGPVHSVVCMPTVLVAGLAAALIPSISAANAKKDYADINKKSALALKITLVVSLPAAIGMFLLSQPIVQLLYGGLTAAQLAVSSGLLKISSFGIVAMCMMTVSSSVLQSIGKTYAPLVSIAVGAVVKLILNVVLLSVQSVNIYGVAISTAVCYTVSCIINIGILVKHTSLKLRAGFAAKTAAAVSGMAAAAVFGQVAFGRLLGEKLGLLVSIAIAAVIYGGLVFATKIFTEGQLSQLRLVKGQ